ncbi:transposase, partial [Solitalea sp. MAHUQ-68]
MEKIIIGIDISSRTLDICLKKDKTVKHLTIANEVKAIHAFFKKYSKQDVLVAMENTGRYNWNLFEVLPSFAFKVYVVAPLHLKKSLGLVRGKNDRVDAFRICSFIEKNSLETPLWKPASVAVKQLKVLLTERNSRIKMKRQLINQQQDYKLMKTIALDKELLRLNKKIIETLDTQIAKIETDIEKTIQLDDQMKAQAALIRSVPG